MSETGPPTWTNISVRLGDLKPWADNPRLSTKKQAEKLLQSWRKFGQVETVAVSPELDLYNGHQRLSALLTVYGREYVIEARQSSRHLTEAEKRELTITLHAGATGQWNWDSLSSWQPAELTEWGFDESLLTNWRLDVASLGNFLESEEAGEGGDAEPQTDRAAELREIWGVESGQLWRMESRTPGNYHLLICGDCTDAGVVAAVMGGEKADMVFTDPPYNVDYDGSTSVGESLVRAGYRTAGSLRPIQNDNMPREDWVLFCKGWVSSLFGATTGVCYICMSQKEWGTVRSVFQECGGHWSSDIIWVKDSLVLGRKDYHSRYEAILYGWHKSISHKWYGDRSQTDVWEVTRPKVSEKHPTMKPVELVQRAAVNSTEAGAIIYDPFGGSGTTMIACENLGRRCRMVEISENYTGVILQRYFDAFGIRGELAG